MTWREFIASLVDSLAWPMSVAVIVALLRRQIAALLEAPVKRWKAGPVEFEYWEQTAVEVAENVALAAPTWTGDDEETQRLMALASSAPDAAVVEAFMLLERELIAAAERHDFERDAKSYGARLAEQLANAGAITPETAHAIRGLATLRNLAAHGAGPKTSETRAREFVVLTQAVLFALRSPPRK
ncbi:MAG TPA: hypothetical protein VGV67_09900 [Solirubrobacteraceae bacterium]|nr:hypothetical protein [Solirubrobacteraceae bacterium]